MARNPRLIETEWAGGFDGIKFTNVEVTMRDLFAAFAVCGVQANPDHTEAFEASRAARYAYEVADAMLAEREK